MLVHICCSVDSHYFLSELQKEYPNEKLVGFFYNPNIHPESEYYLRLQDVKRSCDMLGIDLIEGEYDTKQWFSGVKGLEEEPEKGNRCTKCFDIRLEKSAQIAKEIGEIKFTTTLLSSPMKEQEILYIQGDMIGKSNGLDFIKINTRANGGVQRQNELAKKDNLYRQNYCGCKFALSKQREKQNRISLEMMSDIGGQILPGSIEERQEVFAMRNSLEENQRNYILTQRTIDIWRLLFGKILYNDKGISSYILAQSESKNCKSGSIVWAKVFMPFETNNVESLMTTALDSSMQPKSHIKTQHNTNEYIYMGFCKKDDSVFLTLKTFNTLAKTNYKSTRELLYNPIAYNQEINIRYRLCGYGSINPIIIIDKPIFENLKIEIHALFQKEKVFKIIDVI